MSTFLKWFRISKSKDEYNEESYSDNTVEIENSRDEDFQKYVQYSSYTLEDQVNIEEEAETEKDVKNNEIFKDVEDEYVDMPKLIDSSEISSSSEEYVVYVPNKSSLPARPETPLTSTDDSYSSTDDEYILVTPDIIRKLSTKYPEDDIDIDIQKLEEEIQKFEKDEKDEKDEIRELEEEIQDLEEKIQELQNHEEVSESYEYSYEYSDDFSDEFDWNDMNNIEPLTVINLTTATATLRSARS